MNKNFLRRAFNRFLHLLARNCPGGVTLRPFLHRLRGVVIPTWAWIGDDVYIDGEYPERIELHEGVVLSIRSMILAHTRGPGRVIVERNVWIGPGALVICPAGKTLRIGEGAFVNSGAIVTTNVAPGMIIAPPRSVPVGRARVPFAKAKTVEEFVAGMEPLRRARPAASPVAAPPSPPAPAQV